MQDVISYWPQVVAAYTIYLIAVISPGPATLAIIGASVSEGRKSGLTLAAGIFAGSFTWAVAAALGLATVLQTYGHLLEIVKIIGGLYLLYLGYKAFRSALRKDAVASESARTRPSTTWKTFMRGYAIHLTNPKAVFAWVAIISIGLPPSASISSVVIVVSGCLLTGFTVFTGYALLFSTSGALKTYKAMRRWIDSTMAVFFTLAGAKLMVSRI